MFEDWWGPIAFLVFLALVVVGISSAIYFGNKDYRRNIVCERNGGVPLTIDSKNTCAHIDSFLKLPELQP